jgi:hypothetical protein
MESLNFINNLDEIKEDNKLSNETLIGWSATCLDQTISYYLDCNCKKMNLPETEEVEYFNC